MRPREPLINPGIDQRLLNLGVSMKFSIGLLIACITITSAYAATNDNQINIPFRLAKEKIYSTKIAVPVMVYNSTDLIKGHP